MEEKKEKKEKDVEILEVKRTRDKKVRSVLVYIPMLCVTILYIWRDRRPFVASRVGPDDRLCDPEKIRIPKYLYNQIIEQVCAIFKGGEE